MIVDPDFPDHWKTQLLTQLVGVQAPLGLLRLWAHCQNRRTDSFTLTPDMLQAITRLPGKAKAIEKALIESRWISRDGENVLVLGWRERNATWLSRIEGGKKRSAQASRDPAGKLVTAANPARTPPASQLAGGGAGAEERRGEEMRIEPPPSPAAGAGVRANRSDLEATWSLIVSLFGQKKRAAGCDVLNTLSDEAESLPLSLEDQAALQWFYGLPHNEEDIDLRSRYRDAASLAKNLFKALDRANSYRKKNGGAEKKAAAPEPAGWREAMEAQYPGGEIPETWEEFQRLGPSIRTPVLDRLKGAA